MEILLILWQKNFWMDGGKSHKSLQLIVIWLPSIILLRVKEESAGYFNLQLTL